MRLVFIAPDATRDRHRASLAAQGLQVLSETADRDTALKMLAVLAPDLALVEVGPDLLGPLAWAKDATAAAPGLYMVLMGPALDSQELLAVMRAGVREYLPDPTEAEVEEALTRAAAQLRGPAPQPQAQAGAGSGQIAVVYSPKGGSGKSTLAANLAVALYQVTKARVSLMDLSFQFGDLDLLLNLQPHKTIAELIPVIHDLDARALEQAITPSPIGVRLLAAPMRIEDAEALDAEHIERAFEVIRSQPGFTVVDCASHLDAVNCKAIELADVVLLPMAFDLASIRRVARTFDVFKEMGLDTAKIRLVALTDRGEISQADVQRTLGRPVAHSLPWDAEGVAAAINQGVPLMIGQPTAPLATAIRQMAAHLSGTPLETKAKEANPLGKLMSQAFGWLRKKDDVKLLTAGSGAN